MKVLRHITVGCTFWRLVIGAMAHQQSSVDWVDTWRPRHAFGGLSALGVHMAGRSRHDGTALVSQDFLKDFDWADRKAAIQALAAAGMAPEVAAALEWVWPSQPRWLVLGQPGFLEVCHDISSTR